MSSPSPPEYDPAYPQGGNPLEVNVNAQYLGLEYHYVYLVLCAFLVWLIIPGLGFLYGGLARRKSALSLLFQSICIGATSTFQWSFWGYSLAYSRTASPFIGDLANFGMKNVVAAPSIGSAVIPEIVFALYQGLFCSCTGMTGSESRKKTVRANKQPVQVIIGGAFERGRILPSLVFGFLWATLVYCPVACWSWNPNGWLVTLGSLDFAGGGPVHIASGCSALAYALVLGKRKTKGAASTRRGHNTTLVFLGTVLIWFGWFGFNGGSSLNASVRSMYVAFNTNVAASTGVIGWVSVLPQE